MQFMSAQFQSMLLVMNSLFLSVSAHTPCLTVSANSVSINVSVCDLSVCPVSTDEPECNLSVYPVTAHEFGFEQPV